MTFMGDVTATATVSAPVTATASISAVVTATASVGESTVSCCGSSLVLYLGADARVSYTGASADGSYLNAGTATWTLTDSDGVQLATGPLEYDAGSNGDYYGTIDAVYTAALTPDSTYYVDIAFAELDNEDFRHLTTGAAYRTDV